MLAVCSIFPTGFEGDCTLIATKEDNKRAEEGNKIMFINNGQQPENKIYDPFEEAEIRRKAELEVVRIRGSWDAPAFEACVQAEIKLIKEKLRRTKCGRGKQHLKASKICQ